MRGPSGRRVIQIVTSNPGKAREIGAMLRRARFGYRRVDRSCPEIQADSLEEVVRYGLDYLTDRLREPFLIDDSGLFIEALRGFPGVYSAYAYRTLGNRGILKMMDGVEDRRAAFRCVIGLSMGGRRRLFTGECRGAVGTVERGNGGFGFDPVFVPDGMRRTFAEMAVDDKNPISHRGRAVEAVVRCLLKGPE